MYSTLQIFKVEVEKVARMVEVVKTVEMKKIIRRRDSRARKICVEEDAIKDAVKDIIPTSSVTNVKIMATMQIIVTRQMLQLWQNGSLCKRLSSRGKGGRNDQPCLG